MLTAPRRMLTAIALVAAIGCGDDDDDGGPSGTILLSANPTSLSVTQGASGTIALTLVRGGGFSDPVTVVVEGAPAGVTATVTPAQLTGTTTQATVTVTVASTVAAGTYPLTIRGTATGLPQTTVNYTLTVTAAAAIDYQLSANPGALTIAPGASAQTTVNIARTNFTGAVTLSLSNPPAGITATFNPAAPTGTSSQATISVANTVAPGNYNVQIMGAASGVPTLDVGPNEAAAAGDRLVTVAVTVPAPADFTIAAAPNAINLNAGSSGNSTITIARTNLTADIALSLVSPPAGITGVFTPATLSGGTLTSTLAISVGGNVTAGNYPLTVQGVGGGVTKSTTVTVTVAGGGSGNIVWEFCNNEDVPLKFWRLQGTTWAEVPPVVGATTTTFTFTISSASGGVAFTVQNTGGFVAGPPLKVSSRSAFTKTRTMLDQMRASRREARSVTGSLTDPYFDTFVLLAQTTELSGFRSTCAAAPATVTKTFNVTGQAANEEGALGYGGDVATVNTATQYNMSVPAGTYDWAYFVGPAPALPNLAYAWSDYRVGRGEVAPGAAVSVNRTGAAALISSPFTVSGGTTGSIWIFGQDLEGARGSILTVPLGSFASTQGNGNMVFMQPGDRLATDMNSLLILNTELIGNNVDSRTKIQFVGSGPPASGNFALPQSVPPFTTTPVGGAPVPSWTVAGPIPTDYQSANSSLSFILTGAGESTLYTMTATRAYLQANGQSTSYSLSSPVLPNFLTAWAPAAPLVDASVFMTGQTFTTTPVAGSALSLSARLQAP